MTFRPRQRTGSWWPALYAALIVASVFLLRAQIDSGPSSSATGRPVISPQHQGPRVGAAATSEPAGEEAPPVVTAQAFAVVDGACGALIHGRNAHQRLAPASLVKLATALVAVQRADLDEQVAVSVDGAALLDETGSTIMGLTPGSRLPLRDLLYGLLLPSGNDAALAIAEYIGGNVPAFVRLMNQLARELALKDTHFTNPHGLDEPGLYASAADLALLGRRVAAVPALAEIAATTVWEPVWDGPPLWNGNGLLGAYPGLDGLKVGYTEKAGQTMVATAQRDGRRLFVTVLGSRDRYSDVWRLLDWGFESAPSPCSARTP